jgi:soluble lytic murein transglycosylase-like protein
VTLKATWAAGRILQCFLQAGIAVGLLLYGAALSAAPPINVEQSDPSDLRREAQSYEHGEGVAKDPARAIELYCAAARRGDPEAQFSMGWMVANGRGVARDDALAAFLFRMAAEAGHEYAQRMVRYFAGAVAVAPPCFRETPPDKVEESIDLPATTADEKKIRELVHKVAPEFRISPKLALAIIRAESNFDAKARSPKNAQGLMQLIPQTSERFRVRKPYDPLQNLRGGLAYLRWLLAYFKGDIRLVAAGYNSGEKTVERYGGVPPYPETREYVRRVSAEFGSERHPYDPGAADPSPFLDKIKASNTRRSKTLKR